MRFPSKACLLALAGLSAQAADHTIAVVGLVHSHVWGHLRTMVAGKPARLVGVAETLPDLVDEAKKRGVPENLLYGDVRKMLDTAKPEIVWAFVENNRHREIAELCAQRKIHLMFEKPLASTYKDALAIRDLARKHGIHVLTNYQMAWWPSNYAAQQAATSGAVGKVWRLRGVVGHGGPGGPTGLNKHFFTWLTDPEKNGGGALIDFGCYNALWGLWYLGRPATVYAQANHLRPQEFGQVEDNSVMVLSYPEAVGIFEGSWDLPRSFQELEVFGFEGSLNLNNARVELRKSRAPAEELKLEPLAPAAAEPVAAMIAAIESGKAPAGLVALDINVGVVEILEAARQSVKTGRAVPLPLR
jgi:predicted dehydrogenase